MTRQTRQVTSWTGRITEANLHLADLILNDSPVSEAAYDEFIPLDAPPPLPLQQ